jgi:hypothetical protein
LKEKFMGNMRLINFRMPVDAINRFDAICHANGRSRTSVLAELMTQYVLSEGPRQMAVQAHLNELDRHLENSRGKNVDTPLPGGFGQIADIGVQNAGYDEFGMADADYLPGRRVW